MATINPISTSLRLVQSVGEENGKAVTKTASVSVNVNADADVLHNTAESLSSLLAHPVMDTRRSALGSIVE